MPTLAALDIDSLIAPISGERPAGDATAYPYVLREKLLELRQEERADDFDDATRPETLKRADYPKIVEVATEALKTKTKDVRLACHLIEALTRTQGFAGLRDGLCLLRRLLDECWDRLEPSIDDGDLEVRSSPIVNLLDDAVRGFCFPNTVRTTPVFTGQSVSSWQNILKDKSDEAKKTIALVRAKSTAEALIEPKQLVEACLSELDALIKVMDERLESFSPSLSNLHGAIDDARLMIGSLWPKGGQSSTQTPSASAETPAANAVLSALAPAQLVSAPTDLGQVVIAREAVYAQLTQAAEALATLEPHSPIPYLVRRAVELGKLPFPQLVQKLIREEAILSELQREFGLSAATADSTTVPTTSA